MKQGCAAGDPQVGSERLILHDKETYHRHPRYVSGASDNF